MLTKQEVFDIVAVGLIKQGVRSYVDLPEEAFSLGDGCLYRGPNSTKCAAGMLIPDELYEEKMEGVRFLDLEERVRRGAYKSDKVNGEMDGFITMLQTLHDSPYHWSDIKGALVEFAHHHSLSTVAIDNL